MKSEAEFCILKMFAVLSTYFFRYDIESTECFVKIGKCRKRYNKSFWFYKVILKYFK